MKTKIIALLLALSTACVAGELKKSGKPDFLAYNPDGSIKKRGVYQTNEKGQVVKYSMFDGTGALLYTEVPYYAEDGRIVRADHLDAQGRLEKVVVYFEDCLKIMDSKGELLETGRYSQKEYLQSAK